MQNVLAVSMILLQLIRELACWSALSCQSIYHEPTTSVSNFPEKPEMRRNFAHEQHFPATLVANPQQHRRKSASMALQPYAAPMASHMVAHGLGQMDWEFK